MVDDELLKCVAEVRGENGGEGLKSLHDWISASKEAHDPVTVVQQLSDANGLEAIVTCMKSNSTDTIVATRALEILAGEPHSMLSLPCLDDHAARSKLVSLGFVEIVLDLLRLPNLQSMSRGLGSSALRHIAAQHSDRDLIVKNGGVQVLLDQVLHVDRPFTFAALAVLASSSSTACAQVRNDPHALKMLLSKYAQNPLKLAPEEDPKALLLFLCVWTWDELDREVKELSESGADVSEAYALLEGARHKRYSSRNATVDIGVSIVDLMCDCCSSFGFYMDHEWLLLGITSGGFLVNTVLSTFAMKTKSTAWWQLALNTATLGSYAMVNEALVSRANGFKTVKLTGFKMFEAVESFISFFVGTYSILSAGYVKGDPLQKGFAFIARRASVFMSLVSLPLTAYDVVHARTAHGLREFGGKYLHRSKRCAFIPMLFLYQASEVWAQVTILIFQMSERPFGVIYVLCAHALSVALAFFIGAKCFLRSGSMVVLVHLPMIMIFTTLGGRNGDLQLLSRIGATLRIVVLAAVWVVIAERLSHNDSTLLEHLQSDPSCKFLVGLAIFGTVLHFLCFCQQGFAGRWAFDMHTAGAYEKIHADQAVHGMQHLKTKTLDLSLFKNADAAANTSTGGVYQTAAHAPKTVGDRWLQVHELLPGPTARVTREAFVKTHLSQAGSAANGPFESFLNAMFDTATALMLPKKKDDLGKHCFGYATLMIDEYYAGQPGPKDGLGLTKTPAIAWFDPLKVLRVQLQDDWQSAQKDASGHVLIPAFKMVFLARHLSNFGGLNHAKVEYDKFLDKLFHLCQRFSGVERGWLDHHGFLYGGLLSYEFYFADARDREAACGCGTSTPVADNLGITR